MAIQGSTKKYVPNLKGFHSLCDANYVRMLKLLPDCDTESLSYEFGSHEELQYQIQIVEASRYTTTLEFKQVCDSMPNWMKPTMKVRMYHDARMAEVLSSQNITRLAPSYDYPNNKMHQKNEKEMVNRFLAEWLVFCLNQKANMALQ